MKWQELDIINPPLSIRRMMILKFPFLLTQIHIFPIPKNKVNGIGKVLVFIFISIFLITVSFNWLWLTDHIIEHRTIPITEQQRILKLLFYSLLFFLLVYLLICLWLFLFLFFVLFYVCVKVVKPWAVEFANLLEPLFELYEFEFREIFVQVLGDGLAGRFEDGVPVITVVVPGEGQFVHDEHILHINNFITTQVQSTEKVNPCNPNPPFSTLL